MRASAITLGLCAGLCTVVLYAADIALVVYAVFVLFYGAGWWPMLYRSLTETIYK